MIAAAGGAVVGAYAVAIPVTEESSIEAIKLCLDRGVDINAFNTNGTTAVHSAVQRGAREGREVSGRARRQARHEEQAGPHAARHRPRRGRRRAEAAVADAAAAARLARRWRPFCDR